MDSEAIRMELQRILREFLAEYAAASESSWQRHRERYAETYLLPSRGRFFTVEERSDFAIKSAQLRTRAERILSGAGAVPVVRDPPWMEISRTRQLEEIRRAFSLMTETEAEAGRWSGSFPAYVEHLIEEIPPGIIVRQAAGSRKTISQEEQT